MLWRIRYLCWIRPLLRVLNILCHNELALAMGVKRSKLYKVPWYKRVVAHFVDVNDENIHPYGGDEQPDSQADDETLRDDMRTS